MEKYYKLMFSEGDEDVIGVAYTTDKDWCYVDDLLLNGEAIKNWKPIVMELRDGIYMDLLPSNTGRVYSKKIKDIIDKLKSPEDCIQWLPVEIKSGNETREYYILHFCKFFDAVDRDKSMMFEDRVIKPVYYENIIKNYHIFIGNISSETPIVFEDIKKALKKEKVTGIDFKPIKIS